MTRNEYSIIESYMLNKMHDSAHDKHHVYRVLYAALDIAESIKKSDVNVLIAACLLHDIGREKQFANPNLCHAQEGGKIANEFLLSQGWSKEKANHVMDCISTHRFRGDNLPQSIEAKILFDADKLEASGAMGIARTLIYKGQVDEPLYNLSKEGNILFDDKENATNSFFQEYNFKLKNIYDAFYTVRAREIAAMRQKTAIDFYNGLLSEITDNYKYGIDKLNSIII